MCDTNHRLLNLVLLAFIMYATCFITSERSRCYIQLLTGASVSVMNCISVPFLYRCVLCLPVNVFSPVWFFIEHIVNMCYTFKGNFILTHSGVLISLVHNLQKMKARFSVKRVKCWIMLTKVRITSGWIPAQTGGLVSHCVETNTNM